MFVRFGKSEFLNFHFERGSQILSRPHLSAQLCSSYILKFFASMTSPRFIARASSFQHPKSRMEVENGIGDHPFINKMEILIPFSTNSLREGEGEKLVVDMATSVKQACGGNPHYFLVRMPVANLVDTNFVATYIKSKGSFTALSCGLEIERTDVVAVSPDGKLHLAVTKETYDSLGLCGRASKLTPGRRYNICIDMRAKAFVPGRKLHDRVLDCLSQRGAVMEFLCSFSIDGVCQNINFPPSSQSRQLAVDQNSNIMYSFPFPPFGSLFESKMSENFNKEFPLSRREGKLGEICEQVCASFKVGEFCQKSEDTEIREGTSTTMLLHEAKMENEKETEFMKTVSVMDSKMSKDWENGTCPLDPEFLLSLLEWTGMATCRIPRSFMREESQFFSSWPETTKKEELKFGNLHSISWKGLICSSQVKASVEKARSFLHALSLTWIAIIVWGFADAPVSWDGAEHGYANNGGNDTILFIFSDDRFLLFRNLE